MAEVNLKSYCNVLAIESSCDESAVSAIQVSTQEAPKILAESISSQVALHAEYGGVVPELASREHLTNLPLLMNLVLTQSGLSLSDFNLIAFTRGPGLKGCLLMGANFAKGVSLASGLPLLGVNHLEGHLWAAKLSATNQNLQTPYITLLVSGGHTELVLVKGLGEYQVLARTVDDAAGEAFDKSAYLLGFPYPGGAALAKAADSLEVSPTRSKELSKLLPKVMRESEGFSFSGLKTAVSLLVRNNKTYSTAELAYAVQYAIVDALMYKLDKELRNLSPKIQVVLTGGVAANHCLRKTLEARLGTRLFVPDLRHCTDNASMIAYVAGLYYLLDSSRLSCSYETLARMPLDELYT